MSWRLEKTAAKTALHQRQVYQSSHQKRQQKPKEASHQKTYALTLLDEVRQKYSCKSHAQEIVEIN